MTVAEGFSSSATFDLFMYTTIYLRLELRASKRALRSFRIFLHVPRRININEDL